MSETLYNIKVNFEATGIDGSIRQTQRLLYTMNSLRIVVRDIQDLISKPTLENLLFTAINLTQLYNQLYRVVNATNNAAGVSQALGVGAGVSKAAPFYMGPSWNTPASSMVTSSAAGGGGTAAMNLFTRVGMMAAANPAVAFAGGIVLAAIGLSIANNQMIYARIDWMNKQRETAKAQGYEI